MDDLKEKGIKAFAWDFFGKIMTHGMGIIVTIVLARLLEPSEFGLIAMIMVIIGIANIFTDVGLSSALIQRKKVLPIHYSSVFYFNLIIGLILTLITYFSASWIAEFYQNNVLLPLTEVMSLSFVINAFSSVQTTKLRKELNHSVLTKASFIASLLSGVAGVILAFHGAGAWSLVSQTLTFGIIYNLVIWAVSQWSPALLFSFKALKQLWGFGFRMFLSGVLEAIFTRLDYLIIGKLFLPETLGFFQRAKSLNLMVAQYTSGSLMAVLFPVLSQLKNNLLQFQKVIIKMMGIICFVVFLLLGSLYLLSEELIVFLFGVKWLPSVELFQVLVFSGFAYPISALLVSVLHGRGKSKENLHLQVRKKAFVFINFGGLYAWGIDAYLYGLVVTAIVGVILNILYVSREIKLPFILFFEPIIDQSVITVTALVSTLYLVMLMEEWVFIMKFFLFLLIYILMNWVFKTSSFKYFMEQLYPLLIKK